jgi:DNA-binding transcriptional ArsR family regulator
MPELDDVFGALSHPTRRAILARLRDRDATAGELAAPFDVSLPTISKHLKTLEDADLITRRVEGRVHTLALNPKPLQDVVRWLEPYAEAWRKRLDRLDTYLEENP